MLFEDLGMSVQSATLSLVTWWRCFLEVCAIAIKLVLPREVRHSWAQPLQSQVREILSRNDTRLLWPILVPSLSSIPQMTFKVVQVLVEYQPWDQDHLWLQRKNCTSVKNVLTQHPGDLI